MGWKTDCGGLASYSKVTIVCLVSKENLPAFIFKRLVCDQAGDDNKYPRFQKYVNALLPAHVIWIKEIVYYIMNHGLLARWRKWRACDVGEAKEGLENELIFQPFRLFTNVTAHFPTLPSLYLRHSSFSNRSVATPTSQFIQSVWRVLRTEKH